MVQAELAQADQQDDAAAEIDPFRSEDTVEPVLVTMTAMAAANVHHRSISDHCSSGGDPDRPRCVRRARDPKTRASWAAPKVVHQSARAKFSTILGPAAGIPCNRSPVGNCSCMVGMMAALGAVEQRDWTLTQQTPEGCDELQHQWHRRPLAASLMAVLGRMANAAEKIAKLSSSCHLMAAGIDAAVVGCPNKTTTTAPSTTKQVLPMTVPNSLAGQAPPDKVDSPSSSFSNSCDTRHRQTAAAWHRADEAQVVQRCCCRCPLR